MANYFIQICVYDEVQMCTFIVYSVNHNLNVFLNFLQQTGLLFFSQVFDNLNEGNNKKKIYYE